MIFKNIKEILKENTILIVKKTLAKYFTKKKMSIYLFLFLTFAFLYHNDKTYTYYEDNINPEMIRITGKDPLLKLNNMLHHLDVFGKLKKISNPLKNSDIIDIQIIESEKKKLDNFSYSIPLVKKKVKIKVKVNNVFLSAKLNFHGTEAFQYANNKFSYSINLKSPFTAGLKYKKFKLIKGEQLNPPIIAINNLANSMGLISAYGEMKILRINGIIKGDYCFVEDIKKEFLEREFGITNYSVINSTNNWSRKEKGHSTENDLYFGHVEKNKDSLHPKALQQYKLLCHYLEKNDCEKVIKMFDPKYMSKFLALLSVFNDLHFCVGDNLKLIYDFDKGYFYPIYRAETLGHPLKHGVEFEYKDFNTFLFYINELKNKGSVLNNIFKILLSDNSIRIGRDRTLYGIIKKRKKIIDNIQYIYQKNEKVMLHATRSRRIYNLEKIKQINLFNKLLDYGNDYLKYTHIYGSYDKEKKELHVFCDAFSPINISHKTSKFRANNVIGIEFDKKLKRVYKYKVYHINEDDFKVGKLIFINALTKDTIKKNIHFNIINTTDTPEIRSTEQMLKDNQINYSFIGSTLLIHPKTYIITSNIIIPSNYSVKIPAGTTFKINDKLNILIQGNVTITGSKQKNVTIENLNKKSSFGCFSIRGVNASTIVNINYLKVSGGSASYFSGKNHSGQFAIYNSTVRVSNSTFCNSLGDDGLNVKFSKVILENCNFFNNQADQMDLDFCFARIKNCNFTSARKDSNGDGIDLSGSYAEIENCNFSNFLDKSLSLGEKSKVLVHNCMFKNNNNAIAVKDQTKMYSWNNLFESNKFDYYSFIKKPIFSEPDLYIKKDTTKLKLKLSKKDKIHYLKLKDIEFEKTLFRVKFNKYKISGTISNKSLFN